VSDALVSATDILPTLAALTGASLPSHHVYDGIDISNIAMKGQPLDNQRVKNVL
jgi:arylsulfatase A-like enzyme